MTDELTRIFKNQLVDFMATILKSNFYQKFEPLQNLVTKYNDLGLSKSEILKILNSQYSDYNDDYKEEVLGEILSRIEGHTSNHKIIKLKE